MVPLTSTKGYDTGVGIAIVILFFLIYDFSENTIERLLSE